MSQRLNAMQTSVNESMNGTTETIKKVGEDLGALRGAAQRMVEEGQKVSGLVQVLEKPTLRGGFGEFLLDRLLSQVLPSDSYSMPHQFSNGTRVDAAIFLADRIVSVDAKFPMESFQRLAAAENDDDRRRAQKEFDNAVKGHINAITKYILPDEGTFDFALMYIPAENVYYEVILKDENGTSERLADYAFSKRVIPVSPNSFYLYLMSVALGLHGYRMEQNARFVLDNLIRVSNDFGRLRETLRMLGRHISHADGKWREVDQQAEKLFQRLQLQAPLAADSADYTLPLNT
jgi:DNA recombination protein RmuC